MAAPIDSNPEQTQPSTQNLPRIPTAEAMEDWDREKVLKWIQDRKGNLLEDDDLVNFRKARIAGTAFLDSNLEFFNERCKLSPGASLGLMHLVNQVTKGGKFIPWT